MKFFLMLFGFLLVSISTSCSEEKTASLEQYKWKNRIILTYPSDSQTWAEQLKMMRQFHAKLADRDLVILRLDTSLQSYSKSEREELMKIYKLTKGTHILIGKDGGEKDRQSGALNLKKWFDLIDTMPMRKREMKR